MKLLVLIWNNYEATEMGEGNREGRKAISIEQKQIPKWAHLVYRHSTFHVEQCF